MFATNKIEYSTKRLLFINFKIKFVPFFQLNFVKTNICIAIVEQIDHILVSLADISNIDSHFKRLLQLKCKLIF